MRPLTATIVLLAALLIARPGAAQDPPPKIGPLVIDVQGTIPQFPGDDQQLADSRGLLLRELPGRGLGLHTGAHVYLLTWKAVTFGLGADVTVARSHAKSRQIATDVFGRASTERLTHVAPQLSFNFGDGEGWSYLSGGIGTSTWTLLLRRISIRTKVVIMIVGMSAVFGSGILGFVYYQLQNTLRDEALNKALILADGLSVKAAEPVQVEDLNALQFILGEAIGQADVAYAFIRDGRGRVLSSSFEGNVVPPELQNINQLQPNVPFGTESTNLVLKDTIIEVTDIASPVGGGALGSIHIGLNITRPSR